MKKVFCRDCRYHKNPKGSAFEICEKSIKIINDYYEENIIPDIHPSVKNKNNDCGDYEEKEKECA